MGYADGYYYGQGRIICDTSTFSVGDTIRVRSMTDSNKVWNKTVATVGTPLVFTVPCYDYYKICTVQDIGGTPTEIGGVYKTVDFGQTLFINVLDKKTVRGVKNIVNAHNESILAIGDEVTVQMADDSEWIMQVGAINPYESHEVVLVSKYTRNTPYKTHYLGGGYTSTGVYNEVKNFYYSIKEEDKACISTMQKEAYNNGASPNPILYEDYTWIPNRYEASATGYQGTSKPLVQFPIFTTQANRIRKRYDTLNPTDWACCDEYKTGSYWYEVSITSQGVAVDYITTESSCVLPCFHIVADS